MQAKKRITREKQPQKDQEKRECWVKRTANVKSQAETNLASRETWSKSVWLEMMYEKASGRKSENEAELDLAVRSSDFLLSTSGRR